MKNQFCPVCKSMMSTGVTSWHWDCKKCGYEKADFEPAINEPIAHEHVDEEFREKGLRSLRTDNFSKLLRAISTNGANSGQLLDVGCAHGWFLEAAQNYGFSVLGIEPDVHVFNLTSERGLPIRLGLFPDALEAGEQFDVIVFNDVLEHIPDINSVLDGCEKHLKPEGMLVLNLPSSSGIFYKVSRLLSRLGINGVFERLWQKGFPSPHLHYFNPNNLRLLLRAHGFEEISAGRLSTVRLRGLLARVSHTGTHSFPVSLGISFLAILAMPILWAMPSDIVYSISKKSK